jgi:hypothetical protein
MRLDDEIDVLRLFDQAEAGVRRYDTVDLRCLVTSKDDEQARGGADALVLKGGERQRLPAVIVAALAEELAGSVVTPCIEDFRYPLVDFAEKHLGAHELFERSGHRVLPVEKPFRRDT